MQNQLVYLLMTLEIIGLTKFSTHKIDCVIHLAGSKSISESMEDPINYFVNNVLSTNILLKSMKNLVQKNCYFLLLQLSVSS